MKNKILIIVLIIILILVIAGIYFYTQKGLSPTVKEPIEPKPPISEFEAKFFCFNFDYEQGNPEIVANGNYFYKEYIRRLYECVGYTDVNECEANRQDLELIGFEDIDGAITTCTNNSNGMRFLKTQDSSFLEAIEHEDLKQTYLAISQNDQSLCPADFPFCNLVFTSSCYSDSDLKNNNNLLFDFARLSSYTDPVYSHVGREEQIDVLLEEVSQNKKFICGTLDKENQVVLNKGNSCSMFDKENTLLERLAFMRCSNFIQDDKNFCKDELKRLTNPLIRTYINNKCGIQ
jgi:hypothetical protein